MPFLTHGDVRLHYAVDGPDDAPALLMSNSLGTDFHLWAPQMAMLADRFRVVRYDTRGHGGSSVPDGPYTIDQLGHDALAVLDHLGIERAHFVGLSMGGLTGIWLASHAPQRMLRVVLANTGAKIGTAETWNPRIDALRASGAKTLPPAMADAVLERWFTPRYRAMRAPAIDPVHRMLLDTSGPGYAANCAAIRDADLRSGLPMIRVPVLVVAGTHDPSTPPQLGRDIAEAIPGARYVEFDAAHLSNVEQAGAFNAAVLDFLTDGGLTERDRLAIGRTMRRSVLGDAHVDRSDGNRTDFNGEFLDAITRSPWGDIWTRPGLARDTRSLLTIGMLIALGHHDELKLHLNAARNNGVTREQIKETLLQASVYCGVPAANTAFKIASEVFAAQDA